MILFEHPQTLAYVASAVGVAMVVPQIQRIVRNPAMGGVSPWSWALTVVACSMWMTYGVRTGSMPQIPGNLLLISGSVAVVLLVPAAWSRRTRALTLATLVAVLVLVAGRLSPEAVGFLAFGIGMVGVWPQVFETVWLRRGMGPSALSLSSIGLKIGSQTLWWAFAALTFDLPVIVSASVLLLTNATVLAVETARRRAVAPDAVAAAAERAELAAARV